MLVGIDATGPAPDRIRRVVPGSIVQNKKSLSGLMVGRAFVLRGGVAGSVVIVALALVNLDKVIFNAVNKPVHIVNAAAPISA